MNAPLRLVAYLHEMIGWGRLLLTASAVALACAAVMTVHGPAPAQLSRIVLTAITVALLLVVLRAFDDLKDWELDSQLFPQRPSARGLVSRHELTWLALVAAALALVLNVQHGPGLIALGGALVYSALSRFWFFAPRQIKASLPMAFLTHHPLVAWMYAYALANQGDFANAPPLWVVVSAVPLVLGWTAWELARKIRPVCEETAYVTYSRVFGTRVALVLLFVVVAVAAVLASGFVRTVWLRALVGAAALSVGHGIVGLWRSSPTRGVALKRRAELFGIAMQLAYVGQWLGSAWL